LAGKPNGISVPQGAVFKNNAADERRISIRSNTPEARLKPPAGRLSLFDAVPFWPSPQSWPHASVLPHGPLMTSKEAEQKNSEIG
jgi:hypothetical protein